MLILVRELGITLLRFIVIRHGVMPAGRGGKLKTVAQSAAILIYITPLPDPVQPVAKLLMAVALVIFARWSPLRCVVAALLFGAAGAIGPALQSIGISQGYYFFNAAPYILTLVIMAASAGSKQALRDVPGELSITE